MVTMMSITMRGGMLGKLSMKIAACPHSCFSDMEVALQAVHLQLLVHCVLYQGR